MDDARKTMLAVIADVAKEPPSKEEVDRAKTRILKNIDLGFSDSERVGLFLSEYLAQGDWRLMFLERDRVKAVTPEDVKRVAAAYLKPSNQTIGEFIPEAKPDRAEVPAKTDVAAEVKDYKGEAAMAQGEAFEPSPANIDARTTRFTLPSGMKVVLLEKKTRGGVVHAQISLHFGTVATLKNKDVLGSLTASALMRGTANKNRQQIQDQIDQLKAQLNVGGSATGATASIETTKANLIPVLQLASEILQKPTIPESEFEEIRKEELAGLENAKNEPQALAPMELERTLKPYPRGDVRNTLSFEDEIEDVTKAKVEDARAFHKEFYGANHGEVAIVGDFDPAEVKKTLTDLFGKFTNNAPYERVKMGFEKTPVANKTIETPDKQNAMFVAGERLNLADTDPNYPGLAFANYMLGGGFLNSRFATRIRVKDGLSYGVGSRVSASSHEPDGEFMVYAIAAPQNIAKVEIAFKEELARALKDGFTPSEVDNDKAGWLQSRQVNRSDDRALTGALASNEQNGRTFAFSEKLESTVRQMTPEQILAAFRATIDPERITIVKAGDFKKAAGK
jgi:zinc protease